MGLDHRHTDNDELELELVREVVLARRRLDGMVMAALALGAELLDHDSEDVAATRAAQILDEHAVDEAEVALDPRGALRADMARDRARAARIGLVAGPGAGESEEEDRKSVV